MHAVLAVFTTEATNAQALFDASYDKLRSLNSERIYTAIEDAGSVDHARINLSKYSKLLYASLTWNFENDLAGGASTDIGLKQAGKRFIAKMNAVNVALDTAHLSRRAFYDCLDLEARILCTHTACDALWRNSRNLTDEQISELINRGGIIGVAFVRQFMTDRQFTSANVAAHIDHIVQRHGAGSVCIGSDFYGTGNLPDDLRDYSMLNNLVKRFYILGYSSKDIEAILYKNALKFFKIREENN